MADNLLSTHRQEIESLTMMPSDGGKYEVIVDGTLIYSKKATGRHAEPGEVEGLFAVETGLEAVPAD